MPRLGPCSFRFDRSREFADRGVSLITKDGVLDPGASTKPKKKNDIYMCVSVRGRGNVRMSERVRKRRKKGNERVKERGEASYIGGG